MSSVVIVPGKSAGQRLTSSTCLPRVEQHLGDARDRARAVVVEDDDPLADRARPEQHVPAREHVVLVAPGSCSTSGFTLEKPVRLGTAPVATSTPSGVEPGHERPRSPRFRAGPRRPAFRSCTSRSRVIQPNSSRPGVRRIRLTCPPSASLALERA